MNSWAETIPADEIAARSRTVRPGRVALLAVSAIGVAIGWTIGMALRILGWLAGRTWLILVYLAETVIFGFRAGAGLPPQEPPGKV